MQNPKPFLTKIIFFVIFILGINFIPTNSCKLIAEETALEKYEPRYIVDMPTAGMLENLSYSVNAQLVGEGGFLFDFTAAFFKFLNFGISYGGTGVIGHQTMNLQKYPGLHLKFRIFNEDEVMPAIALGFNSQGKGMYHYGDGQDDEGQEANGDKAHQRHDQLAPDFYLAASKSFKWALGNFSINAGLNYALQHKEDKGINVYTGIEHSIYKYCAVAFELNPNLNDKNKAIWKDGKSFMVNGALRIAPIENIIIEVQFKDFLTNSKKSDEVGRYFGVQFISRFF